ncbi:MAG: apolipoprotein N-acyltransferase [Pseudomonadales bacterium]
MTARRAPTAGARLPPVAAVLLPLTAGALLPLSLAPFDLWPLGVLSLAGWFLCLHRFGGGAWSGWWFGVGKYGVGASWVYVSIHVYGNAPPLLAGLLVVIFVAGLALFPLLNGWLFRRLASGAPWADAALFVALYGLFEWLLTWALTGFPWLFAGYAHLATPLAGLAPVGGVLLLGTAVAIAAVMLVLGIGAALAGRWRRVAVAAAIALLPWVAGAVLMPVGWVEPGARQTVALVQGDVPQSVKWEPERRQVIADTYLALTEPHWDADLIIWPEAALTYLAHEAQPILARLDARGRASGTALLLGLPAVERLPGDDFVFRNTAVVVGEGDGRYVKRRLVPFGEYVPLESLIRGAIEFFDLPMSRAGPGPWRQPLLRAGGQALQMSICYEVVYPDLVRADAAAADVLVTISNDTWFGASIGPLQHLQMAQMRALENGRWMLRGTNNGVTAVIDHRGRVRERLPQFQAGVLRGEYVAMTGTTPYTRLGHGPWLLLLGAVLAWCAGLRWLGRAAAAGADERQGPAGR